MVAMRDGDFEVDADQDGVLAGLTRELGDINKNLTILIENLPKVEEKVLVSERRIKRRMLGFAAVLLIVLGIGVTNFVALRRIDAVNDSIKDCTDPTGQCYQDGQRRTSVAVEQIITGSTQGSRDNKILLCELIRSHGTDPLTIPICKSVLEG